MALASSFHTRASQSCADAPMEQYESCKKNFIDNLVQEGLKPVTNLQECKNILNKTKRTTCVTSILNNGHFTPKLPAIVEPKSFLVEEKTLTTIKDLEPCRELKYKHIRRACAVSVVNHGHYTPESPLTFKKVTQWPCSDFSGQQKKICQMVDFFGKEITTRLIKQAVAEYGSYEAAAAAKTSGCLFYANKNYPIVGGKVLCP